MARYPIYPESAGSYGEITCKTAEDFLELLNPFTGPFMGGAHVFRGVESSEYGLQPSAMRNVASMERVLGKDQVTYNSIVVEEIITFQKFLKACDQQGISLPTDISTVNEMLPVGQRGQLDEQLKGDWPGNGMLRDLALAQHYGLRTRMLDWTTNPFHACLFACPDDSAFNENAYCAVWVYRNIAAEYFRPSEMSALAEPGLHLYRPPYGNNPNIVQQKGVLMFYRPDSSQVNFTVTEPIDYALLGKDTDKIVKVLLSHKEVWKLKLTLAQIGLTWSALFPGFGGAVKDSHSQEMSVNNGLKIGIADYIIERVRRGEETFARLLENERISGVETSSKG